MKKQEQRTAIAEACGWTYVENNVAYSPGTRHYVQGCKPDSNIIDTVPDYLNDLNAMHEAERVLDQMQARTYARHLADSEQDGTWAGCHMWSQTAAQRAEAFLKTLNLWKS